MKLHLFALVAFLLCCSGCQQPPPAKRMAVFDPAEYAPYQVPGTGKVVGQAFLVQAGGGVVVAAGRPIILNPVTTYSTEWMERIVMRGENLEPPDSRVLSLGVRETRGDAEGRFKFENLAPGDYYLASWVYWQVGTVVQGSAVWNKVTVRHGETVEVLLTR